MISGLTHINGYITEPEQAQLVDNINAQIWSYEAGRRIQFYGYEHSVAAAIVEPDMRLGPLPDWVDLLAWKLLIDGHMPAYPQQVVVDECTPGQGISAYTEPDDGYGDIVCMVGLLSPIVVNFRERLQRHRRFALRLDPGSVLILRDEARYNWTRAIPPRTWDRLDGQSWARQTWLGITLRNIVLND